MPERKVPESLVDYVMDNMSVQGLMFFKGVHVAYGTLNAVLPGKIPHPVHFREGMSIRNLMRDSGLCKDWDAHDFDDSWELVICKAIDKFDRELASTPTGP